VGIFRQDRLPTTLTPRALAEALRRLRPEIITSYTGVLGRAAEILIKEGAEPLGCRFIVVGAELATSRIRRLLEQAFSGKVLDTYSSQEVGLIAWECPHTGLYHVCDDNVILEVLKDGCRATSREGEEGEVVVTGLHALAMPFLRFRLEDVVVRGPNPCPCGAPYSTIAGIRGRFQDYFLRSDGREVDPTYIASLFPEHAPWVGQYDLEQDEGGRVLMRVVPLRPPGREDIESCCELAKSVFGQGVDMRIDIVQDIPAGPGGKYYYHRSPRLSAFRPEDWESS
jgi:phenylacetate-CoA ligase